jgi:hypothetical protein
VVIEKRKNVQNDFRLQNLHKSPKLLPYIFKAASVKQAFSFVLTLCNLVGRYKRFEEIFFLTFMAEMSR